MHICSDTQAGPCTGDHLRMWSSRAPSPLTLPNPDYVLQAPLNARMSPIARDIDEVPSREAASQVGPEQGQRDQRSQDNRGSGHRMGIREVKADLKVDINKGP